MRGIPVDPYFFWILLRGLGVRSTGTGSTGTGSESESESELESELRPSKPEFRLETGVESCERTYGTHELKRLTR